MTGAHFSLSSVIGMWAGSRCEAMGSWNWMAAVSPGEPVRIYRKASHVLHFIQRKLCILIAVSVSVIQGGVIRGLFIHSGAERLIMPSPSAVAAPSQRLPPRRGGRIRVEWANMTIVQQLMN